MRSNHVKRMMNIRKQTTTTRQKASHEPVNAHKSPVIHPELGTEDVSSSNRESIASTINRVQSLTKSASRRRWLKGFSLLRHSSEVVGAIITAKLDHETQEYRYTSESLHTFALLNSSLSAETSHSPPVARKCCTQPVALSWMVLCMQLTMTALLASGYMIDFFRVTQELDAAWTSDCSKVDRCDYYGAYSSVCMARVESLGMSGAKTKGCFKCPPIKKLKETFGGSGPCDMTSFVRVDDLAGDYFDFWANTLTFAPDMDLNGPFELTCSADRKTSFNGMAGKQQSCVDCFGKPCDEQIYVDDPNRLNFLGTNNRHHCRERYACDAFNYDDGRCDPAFFKAVCTHNATAYPRRFSEMPGLEFLRNWPHDYSHSCDGTPRTDNRTLLTASDERLTPAEYLRLEALCHLHSTCVRSQSAAGCTATEGEKLRQKSRENSRARDADNLWSTGQPYFAHTSKVYRLPRPDMFLVAVAVFFVVATEISSEHHGALLCMLWIDIISRRQRGAKGARCCGGSRAITLSWILNLLRREVLVPIVPFCTMLAVLSAQTTFNIVLNGFVSVVTLQMDTQIFFALYTEAQFYEMRDNYQLVLGRREEHVLRREIWAVSLSAWIFMVVTYLAFPHLILHRKVAAHSEVRWELEFLLWIGLVAGFTVFKHILSTVFWCCTPAQSSSTKRCRPRNLLCRLFFDILWSILSLSMIVALVFYVSLYMQLAFHPRYRWYWY